MQPDLILIPFGKNATPGTIDPIPKTRGPGDDPQQATWDEGFPQVTMTPLAAGGIPPKGQDFNGVLKAISEHTVFTERGGQFKWSSDYVTESGGYSIGDVVQADDGLNSYVSLVNTNTTNFNTTPASIGTSWGLYAGRNTQAQATESVAGIAKIATSAQVIAGLDDACMMTALKTKAALNAYIPPDASTIAKGVARFGTAPEQLAGLLESVMSNPAGVMALLTSWFPKRVFAENDYIRIPNVAGGLLFQWASGVNTTVAAGASSVQDVTFPTPFPTGVVFGIPSSKYVSGAALSTFESPTGLTNSKVSITTGNPTPAAGTSKPLIFYIGY